MRASGTNIFLVDPKDDSRYLACNDDSYLIIAPTAPFNILQIPKNQSKETNISTLIKCFCSTFYGGEHTKQVLNEALQRVFSECPNPSLEDLMHCVERLSSKSDTFSRRDAIAGVAHRLQRISYNYPGLFSTRQGISFEELFKHSLYIPVVLMDETTEFLTTYLIHQLYLHNRMNNIRDGLTHLVSLDEGLLSWNKNQNKIEGAPLLSSIHSMVREFSIGMLVTTTSILQIDQQLKSNSFLQICMNLTNSAESNEIAKTFGLSQSQKLYLDTKLTRGECIIKFADTWRSPILATFPPPAHDKTVSLADWHEAERRIYRYAAPLQTLLPVIASVADNPETIKQETSIPSNLPPKDPQNKKPDKLPKAATPKPKSKEQPLKLTPTEEKLLEYVCNHLAPTSNAYKILDIHPIAGTAAKKKLITLDLANEEPVIVRPGRGGKAKVLFPTEKAFQILGLKPLRGTRGGDGPQHRYLCRTIADLLPEAQLELSMGGKSIDVFFLYKEALHLPLMDQLRIIFNMDSNSQATSALEQAKEGAAIGIEVECSDPSKTTTENIRKNVEVGVSLTLFAVMPDQLAKAETLLKDQPNALVLDALKLLNALQEVHDTERTA